MDVEIVKVIASRRKASVRAAVQIRKLCRRRKRISNRKAGGQDGTGVGKVQDGCHAAAGCLPQWKPSKPGPEHACEKLDINGNIIWEENGLRSPSSSEADAFEHDQCQVEQPEQAGSSQSKPKDLPVRGGRPRRHKAKTSVKPKRLSQKKVPVPGPRSSKRLWIQQVQKSSLNLKPIQYPRTVEFLHNPHTASSASEDSGKILFLAGLDLLPLREKASPHPLAAQSQCKWQHSIGAGYVCCPIPQIFEFEKEDVHAKIISRIDLIKEAMQVSVQPVPPEDKPKPAMVEKAGEIEKTVMEEKVNQRVNQMGVSDKQERKDSREEIEALLSNFPDIRLEWVMRPRMKVGGD